MTSLHIESASLVASLVSMLLISWGSFADGPTALTVIGGLLLAVSLAALTVLRYADPEEDS